MPEANPETGAVTDESSAVERVASLLEPEGPTEQEQPEGEAEGSETQEAEAGESPEQSSEEKPETEPESEGEELPDTLEGLAEALEMDPADLAGHLKVPVKVGGKVEHVTLADAIKGQQFEGDYRQKTTELAEQRRKMEADALQASERWQQKVQALQAAIQTVEAGLEAEPSDEALIQLMEDDPQEYLRVTARQKARQKRLEDAKKTYDEQLANAREEASEKLRDFRVEQQRILSEKMPEVSDPKKLQAFESGSQAYLKSLGFSGEEVSGFFGGPFDHRQVLIIRDAMKFRALQEGKKTLPKKLHGLAKVQKPGAAQGKKSDTDKMTASSNRLRQLKHKGTRDQQNKAAIERVKMML
jgi:hypothetical protein